ncbi:hypothetical protein [Paenibacillus sp. MMO-177]|uniref:hypothetical protein n=1 Tax=Paenibacillus sp. MMO-177 TaxID=3081289 RepID=UPI0030195730
MDYWSPANHLYAILHYAFAIVLLYVWWPKFFFPANSDDRLEARIATALKSACLYILLGYVLVVLQLYEVMSVSFILLLLSTWRYWRKGSTETRTEKVSAISVAFYGLLETGFLLRNRWQQMRGKLTMPFKQIKLKTVVGEEWLSVILLAVVLMASAYVRFYDAVKYAAPALSDGSVTLAWMKYINNRILFHDGIYPQGFHITLSLISKFAAIDPLYILKYSGPLIGVLTAAGFYFVLSRLTGSKVAGIASAAFYGMGGIFLFGGDWERQAATNSQEFAYLFVFPSLYFMLRYLEKGQRSALWAGSAGLTVAGLAHTVGYAYAGMGLAVLLIASAMTPSARSWKRIIVASAAGLATVIVSYAPIQIAIWSGVSLNSSAEEFLLDTTEVVIPGLKMLDWVGLGSIGLTALSALIGFRDNRRRMAEWFAVGMGTASFLLYYIVPYVTKSTVLAVRTQSLWGLGISFVIGFAWWSLWRHVRLFRSRQLLERAAAGGVAVAFAVYVHLSPIVTYKMEWDSVFRQYLRIAGMYAPGTWTIFSQEEGYSLIYGKGWHQYIRTLVTEYDPTGTPITRNGQDEYDPDTTSHLYIIEEKQVYKVSKSLSIYDKLQQERYVKHEEDQMLLKEWLAKYTAVHGKPQIFYEDEHIRIWYLERPEASDKENRRIWGGS